MDQQMLLTLLLVSMFIGSSVWVFYDATKLGAKPGKGMFDASPQIWLIGCFLFWFLVFPIYLVRRRKLLTERNPSN
jgi:hypothetical protein